MTDGRPTSSTTPGAHPDLDRLADFDAGLLSPSRDAAVRAHLLGCARCRDGLAGITAVRSTLGGLPPVPMPPAVEERILAALRALPPLTGSGMPAPTSATGEPATVSSLDRVRRRRRTVQRGLVAAGLVLLAGSAVAVVGANRPERRDTAIQTAGPTERGGTTGSGAPPGVEAPAAGPTVAGQPGPGAESAGPQAFTRQTITRVPILAGIMNGAGTGSRPAGDGAALLGPMTDQARRLACQASIARAVPDMTGAPLGLQYISFEGAPALVFLYRTVDGHRALIVVDAGCADTVRLLYRVAVS